MKILYHNDEFKLSKATCALRKQETGAPPSDKHPMMTLPFLFDKR